MSLVRAAKLILFALILLISASALAGSAFPPEEASKDLPSVVGEFKATSKAVNFDGPSEDKIRDFDPISAATRFYRSKNGANLLVNLVVTQSDSNAYSLLTHAGCPAEAGIQLATLSGLETRSCVSLATVKFVKGRVYVAVETRKVDANGAVALKQLAQQLSETLDNGEGDIPALVKHLPGWQSGNLPSLFSVNLAGLKEDVQNQPVLDAISFTGGVAAASAKYGAAQLLLVEFNTPQLATDNDQHIKAKLAELRNQAQPQPTAYRRVGNYAVFVFDAPSEVAANQLIDQVKYQQVVQWLGEDPFSYEQATREFTETTLGVFVSVVKASGLALMATLAVGGFLGAMLFSVRRAQQRAREAYSDSDAMLRLNLDELTPESDPARLLDSRH